MRARERGLERTPPVLFRQVAVQLEKLVVEANAYMLGNAQASSGRYVPNAPREVVDAGRKPRFERKCCRASVWLSAYAALRRKS